MPRAMHSLPGKGKEMHPATQNTSLLSPSLLQNVSLKCRGFWDREASRWTGSRDCPLRFLNQFQSAVPELAEASRKNCKSSSHTVWFPSLSFLISFFQPFRSHWWLTLPSFPSLRLTHSLNTQSDTPPMCINIHPPTSTSYTHIIHIHPHTHTNWNTHNICRFVHTHLRHILRPAERLVQLSSSFTLRSHSSSILLVKNLRLREVQKRFWGHGAGK